MIRELITPYNYTIYLIVGDDKEQRKQYKKINAIDCWDGFNGCEGKALHLVDPNNIKVGVISLPSKESEVGTIIHEIAHIIIFCFEHIGMPINRETAEAFCYLQEDLLNQVIRAINE